MTTHRRKQSFSPEFRAETDLDAVAHTLNSRPRKTLDWATPAEALNRLLSEPPVTSSVATTP